MFKVPEKYRITDHLLLLSSDSSYENNGAFKIPLSQRSIAFCIASDKMSWEHVSVHVMTGKIERVPTWNEMCKIKDLFWSESDCVIQYHPPKSVYVDTHKFCLHLWRPMHTDIPIPPTYLV